MAVLRKASETDFRKTRLERGRARKEVEERDSTIAELRDKVARLEKDLKMASLNNREAVRRRPAPGGKRAAAAASSSSSSSSSATTSTAAGAAAGAGGGTSSSGTGSSGGSDSDSKPAEFGVFLSLT